MISIQASVVRSRSRPDLRFEFVDALDPVGVRLEPVVLEQDLAIDRNPKLAPELLVEDAHVEVAVGGREGLVGRQHRVLSPHPAGLLAGEDHPRLLREPGEDRLQHPEVDVLAVARPLATVQRGRDAKGRPRGREAVRDRQADL